MNLEIHKMAGFIGFVCQQLFTAVLSMAGGVGGGSWCLTLVRFVRLVRHVRHLDGITKDPARVDPASDTRAVLAGAGCEWFR